MFLNPGLKKKKAGRSGRRGSVRSRAAPCRDLKVHRNRYFGYMKVFNMGWGKPLNCDWRIELRENKVYDLNK